MRHRARVLFDAHTIARVEVEGVTGCRRCANGQGCGAGIFAHGTKSIQLECKTSQLVSKNQQVMIQIDDTGSRWLWLVAGAYGLPTLGLIGATALASFLLPALQVHTDTVTESGQWREALIAAAALIGLAGGVFAWRYVSPVVIARLEKGLCLQSARIVAVDNPTVGEI